MSLPESVDSSGVLDGDGLAGVVDVAVLADPLVVAGRLLLRDCSVLLGEGGAKLTVSHVEPENGNVFMFLLMWSFKLLFLLLWLFCSCLSSC